MISGIQRRSPALKVCDRQRARWQQREDLSECNVCAKEGVCVAGFSSLQHNLPELRNTGDVATRDTIRHGKVGVDAAIVLYDRVCGVARLVRNGVLFSVQWETFQPEV